MEVAEEMEGMVGEDITVIMDKVAGSMAGVVEMAEMVEMEGTEVGVEMVETEGTEETQQLLLYELVFLKH